MNNPTQPDVKEILDEISVAIILLASSFTAGAFVAFLIIKELLL